ncbi:hypothetical protein SAMN06265375_101910 [Muriicola jejuensis]|uniref:DUF456 family protein n=1 Tax=Muriicola jejuensis TaxID=504488 RepID=A0A6P0UD37_9FLAO|nr:DUF456 domain-containing protein [Muriicola jejuensis]NER09578.1 DUF456 family protein [Muriicola jejuensis]SMP07609.1 hypothetical protein SAMN06265375_101910 [Muriicola jejuensis]
MDIVLLVLGFILMLTGILGSILPVLPGTPVSWVGLLLLYLTSAVPFDWWFLGITLVIALVVFAMDYIIPAMGTRRFGGTRSGMIGTTLGLVVAIIFPVLGIFGIVFWPFLGAFLGELVNKADQKSALKAAFGSFIGFLTGTFLKFVVTVIFLGLFIAKAWEYRAELFPFFY